MCDSLFLSIKFVVDEQPLSGAAGRPCELRTAACGTRTAGRPLGVPYMASPT